MQSKRMIFSTILDECRQGPSTRKEYYVSIEKSLKVPLLSYFTSFRYPVMIDDSDVEIIEQLLKTMDLTNGLALLISSPGGSGLAAERIINICRGYSKTGKYIVLVPGKAKSAATMICSGAEKIVMGIGSELGPVDPQITLEENGDIKIFSAFNIIQSYKELFSKAVKAKGNLEPYLQQLAHYDEREITNHQNAVDLSTEIVIKYLESGMMAGKKEREIRKKIDPFINPKLTKSHGRPITRNDAKKAGLIIEDAENISCWENIYDLYVRLNRYTNDIVSKCVESKDESFTVGAQ